MAFVRSATSDKLVVSLGNCGFAFGPGTMAAVVKIKTAPASLTTDVFLSVGASSAARFNLGTFVDGSARQLFAFSVDNVATQTNPTTFTFVTGTWYLVVVTKTTGTTTPLYYVYDYPAGVWRLVAGNGSTTSANSSVPVTQASIGTTAGGTTTGLDGDFAVGAVWDAVLTQSQIESLSKNLSYANWSGYVKPRGFWRVGPASVYDETGGGANETSRTAITATQSEIPLLNTTPLTAQYRRNRHNFRRTPLRYGRPDSAAALYPNGVIPVAVTTNIKTVIGADYVGGTAVKTVLGVARSSIKTILGLS